MKTTTEKLDVAGLFTDREAQAELLADALAEGDAHYIAHALGIIARAHGMTELARETDLSRQALYRALGENGNPTLDTFMRIIKALGLRITAEPTAAEAA